MIIHLFKLQQSPVKGNLESSKMFNTYAVLKKKEFIKSKSLSVSISLPHNIRYRPSFWLLNSQNLRTDNNYVDYWSKDLAPGHKASCGQS